MVRKRKKKREKIKKPKGGRSTEGKGMGNNGVSMEELEATRKLKQDKIDAQLVHVYNLDSIQQVRDMRVEAESYGVKLEQMVEDTRAAKEVYGFGHVKDYYDAKAESEKYNVTIHVLIKDRETAKLLNQKDVGTYYELRREALSYRITPTQLLLDRIEATKKHLKSVRMLYKQRLESQVRDIKITVNAAGSTKCQIVRSRLAGAFCFYGDFWNTSEYRIDSPWNKAYVEKVIDRQFKGFPSCVLCHRSNSTEPTESPQFCRSLYPLSIFHPKYELTDKERKLSEQTRVANIKQTNDVKKKNRKKKNSKKNTKEEVDGNIEQLSIIEDCMNALLEKRKKYHFQYTIYRIINYPDGQQEIFVFSFEENQWEHFSSQFAQGFSEIESTEKMIHQMYAAMTLPIFKSKVTEKSFGTLNISTLAQPYLSNQAGRTEVVIKKDRVQTSWVIQVRTKRKKNGKGQTGVLSFVDLTGSNLFAKQPHQKFAANENNDLISIQHVLSHFGKECKNFPRIGYSSSLIYSILRPHLPVRPGHMDVPKLSKKVKKKMEKPQLERLEMYCKNFKGTHFICVTELGKHDFDHYERLNSWQKVYHDCTGYQNALILQMTFRRYLARKELKQREDEREFRKQSEAAIKVQTRIRMIFAKRRLKKKKIEQKKLEMKRKAERIKEEKKKFMAQQRLEKKRALLAMKQREKEKKIMAEGGHLPAGWKKEKRGQRWCFQSPDGEWTWNDPR
jgi:hypothetical protein